jgi:NAD(P)-dependent dehydrogenase (short-subunit alcohol dehydrogenase family)
MSLPASFSVKGKRVVITGSHGYLGRHATEAFRKAGAKVIPLDLAPTSTVKNYIQTDITDEESVKRAAKIIKKEFGGIDVIINNAAFNPQVEKSKDTKTFLTYPLDNWEKELRVNITGTMLVSKIFRPLMKKGSVINVSSIYGHVAPDQRLYPEGLEKPASYGTSKGAVHSLTRHLAALWGKDNVRVNEIVMGGVAYKDIDKKFVKKYLDKVILDRMATPKDFTDGLIFLSSDASSYMTGASLIVDGGWTAW